VQRADRRHGHRVHAMMSRWYLLPLVLIVFVLGFLLGPHGGGGQPGATQVKLADIPVSGGDWSLGAVHALPILHGPSVAGAHPARLARARGARAPARRTGGPRSAAAPSTSVGTALAAAPVPAARVAPAATSAPPPPAATPPPARRAPASQSSGAKFDSTGSSTFDTVR
jgi:hypothetical protein